MIIKKKLVNTRFQSKTFLPVKTESIGRLCIHLMDNRNTIKASTNGNNNQKRTLLLPNIFVKSDISEAPPDVPEKLL